jgi:hypothetical protein
MCAGNKKTVYDFHKIELKAGVPKLKDVHLKHLNCFRDKAPKLLRCLLVE